MRSAIYYPHIQVRSSDLMRSSLLLWDRLHTIVPFQEFRPHYSDAAMSEAWELIGKTAVPDEVEQQIAHRSIISTLDAGIPPALEWAPEQGDAAPYEIWPEKFAPRTWSELVARRVTAAARPSGEYPVTTAAGYLLMTKLADAIGGEALCRITDAPRAFSLAPEPHAGEDGPVINDVHLNVLDVVDLRSVPFERLLDFRRRELVERRGDDLTALRHSYLDALSMHAKELRELRTDRLRKAAAFDFRETMRRDFRRLGSELMGNRARLVLKPVIIASVASAASAAVGLTYGHALTAIAGTVFAGSASDFFDKVGQTIDAGFSFSDRQRKIMAGHPMAYMYELSRSNRPRRARLRGI